MKKLFSLVLAIIMVIGMMTTLGITANAGQILPTNETDLDLDSTTTDIKDSKTLDQNYNLTVTAGTYTDVTKVKVEWTINDITASRADAKIWNPNTLTWDDDNANDVINAGEATATFTLTNLSSVKVKAKVEFEAVTGFAPTVVYTGVNATTHKTRIGTVVNDDKSVTSTNPHAATVTVKVTPKKADFASLDATSSATKYGTYTVTISENISDYQNYVANIATATVPETFVVDQANKTVTLKDEEAFLYYGLKWNESDAYNWTAKLDADLDLDELVIANGFNCKANFDGQNHTIANVTVNGAVNGSAGFFKAVSTNVKNLVLDNITVNGGVSTTGGCFGILAGEANANTIENVTVKNSAVSNGKFTGGLIGYAYVHNIKNCSVIDTTVSCQYKCGGLVGYVCMESANPANDYTNVTGNTLTNVTINCANLLEGKNHYETGKVIGDWNVPTGKYINNTVTNVTIVNGSAGYTDNEIGAVESGCTIDYGEPC